MSFNLFNFVKNMLPSFKKDDIEVDMEVSIEFLENSVVPSYNSMENVYKNHKFNSPEIKRLISDFYKKVRSAKSRLAIRGSNNFETDMLTILTNGILPNGRFLQKEIDRIINDTVLSSGLTAYKAFLLRSVSHYYFIGKYASDLSNYILVKEAQYAHSSVSSDFKLNKKQIKKVEDNFDLFCQLIMYYGRDNRTFAKDLDGIPDVIIPSERVEEQIDSYTRAAAEPLPSLPMGFLGSPIYSIRMIFAQWEADRYIELKDKRQLIELRCLHLQELMENGESDDNLEREISYLQKRLTDIDYKVSKIEESAA